MRLQYIGNETNSILGMRPSCNHAVVVVCYCCSGRIRHTTRALVPGSSPGVALINVTLDEGQRDNLEQPFPSLDSWQWVGRNYSISGEQNMSVVLTVRQGDGEDHIQGTAYFDDLCVSFAQGGLTSSPGFCQEHN